MNSAGDAELCGDVEDILPGVRDDDLSAAAECHELLHQVAHEARADDHDVIAQPHICELDRVCRAGNRLCEYLDQRHGCDPTTILGSHGDVLSEPVGGHPGSDRVSDGQLGDSTSGAYHRPADLVAEIPGIRHIRTAEPWLELGGADPARRDLDQYLVRADLRRRN